MTMSVHDSVGVSRVMILGGHRERCFSTLNYDNVGVSRMRMADWFCERKEQYYCEDNGDC